MESLKKTDDPITPKEYRAELARCLAMMLEGLKTYGKKATGSLLDAYLVSCVEARVPFAAIDMAMRWYLSPGHSTKEFPSAPELAETALEVFERAKMAVILEDTRQALKASEEMAALGRRQRNIDAGIDPDEPLPIEVLADAFQNVAERILPEHTS